MEIEVESSPLEFDVALQFTRWKGIGNRIPHASVRLQIRELKTQLKDEKIKTQKEKGILFSILLANTQLKLLY